MKKGEKGYSDGKKVEFTGNTIKLYGLDWDEFIYLEGLKKGKTGVMKSKDSKKKETERVQNEWKNQQEGFKRLRELQKKSSERIDRIAKKVLAAAPPEAEVTVKLSGSENTVKAFVLFLDYMRWCCGVGHSTEVKFGIDGDGADNLKAEFDCEITYPEGSLDKSYDKLGDKEFSKMSPDGIPVPIELGKKK